MGMLGRDERDARIRELEQRLEESERRLEETQALTRVGSWEWPLPDGVATWSKELLRIYGRGPNDRPPRTEELLAAVHPDDREELKELLEKMRAQAGTFDHSYRIFDTEGEVRHLRGRGLTVADSSGTPVRGYGTTQDVSETKRSEVRLEETQSLARVGSWEWTISEDEAWQSTWSREMQRIFGRDPDGPPPSREELVAYVLPEDQPAFKELVARVRSTPGPFEHSYRIVRRDGEIRHMQARGYVEAQTSGQPIRTHGTTQDITELKESQAQLEQAQRLEAVGQLAGGVAHDFNNLLSVILNYAECLSVEVEDEGAVEGLKEIERAASSAAELTRRLLLFSRRDTSELGSVDLTVAVREIESLLRRTIGEHIELTVDLRSGLPPVRLGAGEPEQLLINLVVNARDALLQGGSIAVTVRELDPEGERPPVASLAPGVPHVVLTVEDDGVGMTKEVAAQAFDPFFTTKPRGKGTGLGLATVYGIAGRAGGQVAIESEPGRGTAMSVYLPVATEGERAPAEPRDSLPASGAGRIVLVVDNEPAVSTIVCRMLARQGYQTRAATSGSEAEAILAEPDGEVDLLLTDVLMPGMSGRDLVGRVRERHPGLPAIYMSGYGDDASPLGPWEDGVTVLQKPFTAELLLRAAGEALAEG